MPFPNPKMRHKPKLLILKFLILLIGALCTSGAAYAAYPYARVTNNTPYTVTGEVQYVSLACSDDSYTVAPGQTWTASSRGVCLIDDITGTMVGAVGEFGEKTTIVNYNASPATSYSRFQINAWSGSYRIFSEDEWNDVSDIKHGKSPGFYFVNKTAWPLTYSLDQVGCLHHGIIPTGEGEGGKLKVDTGAVWFTLKIAIQPDGVDPVSNWDCVKPVAELVADVAMAAVTGGGTAVAKAGGKVVVKTVVKEVVKSGVKKAIKSAAKKVIKDLAKDELGKLLTGAGSVELYGQYAGYEWPFRCDEMPEYHIIGGPEPERDEDGVIYLKRGAPFKVMKVNDCGDDMMLASKRSMESDQSSFSDWPGGGANNLQETGDPSCVTFYKGTNGGGASLQLCGAANNWSKYINLGGAGTNFHGQVQSFKCNSGIKSVQFINGNANPMGRHNESCKGGNVVNPNPWVKAQATGVSIWQGYCCGEGPNAAAARMADAKKAAEREPTCATFSSEPWGKGTSLKLCGQDNWNKYTNLGGPGIDLHGKVKSVFCNSGIGTLQFLNGNANPMTVHSVSCTDGPWLHPKAFITSSATGVKFHPSYK